MRKQDLVIGGVYAYYSSKRDFSPSRVKVLRTDGVTYHGHGYWKPRNKGVPGIEVEFVDSTKPKGQAGPTTGVVMASQLRCTWVQHVVNRTEGEAADARAEAAKLASMARHDAIIDRLEALGWDIASPGSYTGLERVSDRYPRRVHTVDLSFDDIEKLLSLAELAAEERGARLG